MRVLFQFIIMHSCKVCEYKPMLHINWNQSKCAILEALTCSTSHLESKKGSCGARISQQIIGWRLSPLSSFLVILREFLEVILHSHGRKQPKEDQWLVSTKTSWYAISPSHTNNKCIGAEKEKKNDGGASDRGII